STESLQAELRYLQGNPHASVPRSRELDRTVKNPGAFAHGEQAHTARGRFDGKTLAMVFDFEVQSAIAITEPDPQLLDSGMPRHVVECLLEDTVDVNSLASVNIEWGSRLFVAYFEIVTPFNRG